MGSGRSRSRDDDDEDYDDRPRRRHRYDDDDDDEDYDDRPRRRRREVEADDRPVRRPRRKSRGPSTGLIVGIIAGIVALIGVVVLVVMLVRGGIGGVNISYAKFKSIRTGSTIESLEKEFGKAKKLERAEWGSVRYAREDGAAGIARPGRGGRDATLEDVTPVGANIDAWYHWHSGSEDIYVASGKDYLGKPALIMKVYTNSNALRENARAGGDFSKMVAEFEVVPVN